MNEDSSRPPSDDTSTEGKDDDPRRPFNPMRTYTEFAGGILAVYVLYFVMGIEFLLIGTLVVLGYVFRQTRFILDYYSYGFARKAAILNAFHATAWFVFLAINVFTIMQTGIPIILPEFESLTLSAPLFVLMAAFGCKNIERMYKPSDEMILARS